MIASPLSGMRVSPPSIRLPKFTSMLLSPSPPDPISDVCSLTGKCISWEHFTYCPVQIFKIMFRRFLFSLILSTRSCVTGFITQSGWVFHFRLTESVSSKWVVLAVYQFRKGISAGPALKYFTWFIGAGGFRSVGVLYSHVFTCIHMYSHVFTGCALLTCIHMYSHVNRARPRWSGGNDLYHSCTSLEGASRGAQPLNVFTWFIGAGGLSLLTPGYFLALLQATFAVSAGPYINHRAKAGTKNELDTFFVPIQKKRWEINPHISWMAFSRGSCPPFWLRRASWFFARLRR